jgi:hypothetical protein
MASKEELCSMKLIEHKTYDANYAHRFPDKGRAINHIHTVRVKKLTQMGSIRII